jgi:hypothetical protein
MKVVVDVSQKVRKALTSFITVLNIVRDARRNRDGGACVRARVCVRVPKIVSLPRGCARSDCESKQGTRGFEGSKKMSQIVLTRFDGLVDGIVKSKPSATTNRR